MNFTNNKYYNHSGGFENAGDKIGSPNYTSDVPYTGESFVK